MLEWKGENEFTNVRVAYMIPENPRGFHVPKIQGELS